MSLVLLDRAVALISNERGSQALRLLTRISVNKLPPHAKAEYFERLAQAFSLTGDPHATRQAYLTALKSYQHLGDNLGLQSVFMGLGEAERQLEMFPSALKRYRSVIRTKTSPFFIDAKMGWGLCQKGLGRYRLAASVFANNFRRYQQSRDRTGMAYALWALATTMRFSGDFKTARQYAHRCLALYTALGDHGGRAYALCATGGILRMMGQAQSSELAYKNARKIFQRLGDQFGVAYSSCGIGNSFRMRGDFKKAKKFSREAEKIYRRLELKGPLAFVLWSLAQIDIAEGRKNEAHRRLTETEKLFRSVHDQRGLVYAKLGWGEFERKFFPSINMPNFRKALRSAKKLNLRFEALHALSRIRGQKKTLASYSQLGVPVRSFLTYNSFP